MSEIPEWAVERVIDMVPLGWSVKELHDRRMHDSYADLVLRFARYIAEHEEPPVDPLLIETREIARTTLPYLADDNLHRAHAIREGFGDEYWETAFMLAALRRGIEIGKSNA